MKPETIETLPVVKEQPIIVFKGKIVGELEETIFTPELIAEKSKPLLALKINGVFDTAGADEMKKAINKSVKMRTAVEGLADPIIKSINAQAKKDVQKVRDIAQPIYDACYETQNALQAKYDAWQLDVKKAADAEAEKERLRTDGRNDAMYELGMTFNGQAFIGYGKAILMQNLHSLSDENYAGVIAELEALKMEQDISGAIKPAPVNIASMADEQHQSFAGNGGYVGKIGNNAPVPPFSNIIHKRIIGDFTVYLTKGQVDGVEGQGILNDRVADSGVYMQAIKNQ